MKKSCTVTYTTFDQKKREVIWDTTIISDEIVNNIVAFVKTGVWPKTSASNEKHNMFWGLRLDPSITAFDADLFGPGARWTQPNKTQYTFFNDLIQKTVVPQLAFECSMNEDFAKALLKEATIRAKKRDDEDAIKYQDSELHLYRDALNRAKRRIRYYQKKYPDSHWTAQHYAPIIEEYELFAILDIQVSVSL